MASNADIKDIKLGTWEFFLGATPIGFIANEKVDIEADPKIAEATVMLTGETPVKTFRTGLEVKVTLTLLHEHKFIIQRAYPWLSSAGLDPTDGSKGSYTMNAKSGKVIPPVVLTGYLHHVDETTNNFFGNDNLNPISIQLPKAVSTELLKWAFSSSEASSHEITFVGQPDFSTPEYKVADFGFVSLPGAGVIYARVTAGGSGYTSAPTATVGTQFAATTAYTINQQVAHLGNLYTVTTAGTSGAIGTAPVHTTGAVASGTATFTYAGTAATATSAITSGAVTVINLVNNGSGYTTTPAITLTGGAGTGAAATSFIG